MTDDVSSEGSCSAKAMAVLSGSAAGKTGNDFFLTLVSDLVAVLDVACALVAETVDSPATQVRTLAACTKDGVIENFHLDLEGTPCQRTIEGQITFFAEHVQALFPQCDILKHLGAESYCGLPFYDSSGVVIGHLVVVDTKKLSSNPADGPAMRILAARAAAELERSRIDAELQRKEKLLRQVLNSTLDAIIVISESGRIVEWNPEAERVFGWSREEAMGRFVHQTVIPDQLIKKHLDGLSRLLETGQSRLAGRRLEVASIRKDGSEFPAELTVSAIHDGHDALFAAFVRDLSAEKEAESQLRQTQDKLAHVSRLCTLGEMVTGVAHELNQPLAAVASLACVAEMSEDRSVVDESLREIGDQAYRAGEIVRRFRALAAKSEPQRMEHDVNQLLSETIEIVKTDLTLEGIDLIQDFCPHLPLTKVDEVQIQQVALNLLRNAIEAVSEVDDGQKRISVCTSQADNQVEVAIADNGPGVSVPNVFEPFVSTKSNGMGMGLAISRTIIERHGGRMWLNNSAELTGFHFRIPIARLASDADPGS